MDATNTAVKDTEGRSKSGRETVISSTDAMDCFGEVIDRAWAGERFQVTKYGKDRVFVLGPKDYERFLAFEQAKKTKRK